MDFTMTVPCSNCPFRRVGGIKLSKSRIKEIGGMMLDSQGGTFPCHKTADLAKREIDIPRAGEIHCAGALIFAEKNGAATQMMRIAERLRIYDHAKLSESAKEEVWDNLKEWTKGGSC